MNFWREPGFWLNILLVTVGGAVVLIMRQDTLRETAFTVLMFVALASSLNIIMGYTGYVNFGHIVFFGLGGYFGFYLLSELGWPLYLAMVGGGCLSVLVALVIGGAVLRLRGAYFALATIGVNEAARAFVTNFEPFGGSTGLYVNFSAYDKYGGAGPALWWIFTLLWIVTIITVIVSYLVKHSRFGLGFIAIREDEDAAMVMGVKAPWAKNMAFALSAFFPALVGTLYFFKNGNVEPEDAFRFQMSLEVLVMVMLGGKGLVLGPILGAFAYERLRGYLLVSPHLQEPPSGPVRGHPPGHRALCAGRGRGLAAGALPAPQEGAGMSTAMLLQVKEVSKRFGGLQALTDVTFDLPEGQILGLIGPNGAGKTTLFNVINGVYTPERGQVIFRGEDITRLPSYEVARRGMARAHQVVRPLTDLTVRENVMVGACFGRERHGLRAAARLGR